MKNWLRAEQLLASGNMDAAERMYLALSTDSTVSVAARLRLSLLEERRGNYRKAVEYVLAASASCDGDGEILAITAKRLLVVGEIQKFKACVEEIVRHAKPPAMECADLAKLALDVFMPDLADKLIVKAKEGGLRSPGLDYLSGMAAFYEGNLQRAQFDLERAISGDALFPHPHLLLSKMKRQNPTENHIRRLLKTSELMRSSIDSSIIDFALFKEYDDVGLYKDAWGFLERGLAKRKRNINFDPEGEKKKFEALRSVGMKGRGVEKLHDGPQPIFIVGLPRTGTTLLESFLARHKDVVAAGELHDAVMQLRWCCEAAGGVQLDYNLIRMTEGVDLALYGKRYLEHSSWRAGTAKRYTDKLPANYMMLGWLIPALPNARFINIRRSPVDACFSNLKEFFAGFYPYSYDQIDVADHFAHYQELMLLWHTLYPNRILDVDYEKFVEQPEAQMRRVLDFCGLDWQQQIMGNEVGTAATPSSAQIRDGIRSHFVARSRHYEENLAPMIRRLRMHGIDC